MPDILISHLQTIAYENCRKFPKDIREEIAPQILNKDIQHTIQVILLTLHKITFFYIHSETFPCSTVWFVMSKITLNIFISLSVTCISLNASLWIRIVYAYSYISYTIELRTKSEGSELENCILQKAAWYFCDSRKGSNVSWHKGVVDNIPFLASCLCQCHDKCL